MNFGRRLYTNSIVIVETYYYPSSRWNMQITKSGTIRVRKHKEEVVLSGLSLSNIRNTYNHRRAPV
jgi:hypothetical protein